MHQQKDEEDGQKGKSFYFDAFIYLMLVRPGRFNNTSAVAWNHLPKELIQCIMIVLNLSRAFIKGQIKITINGRARSFPATSEGTQCREQLEKIKSVIEQFQTNNDAVKNINSIFDNEISKFDYRVPIQEEIKADGSFKSFHPQSAEIMVTLFDLILELLCKNAFGLEEKVEGSEEKSLHEHLDSLFAVCTDNGSKKSTRLNKQIFDSALDRFNTVAAFNEHLLKHKEQLSEYCQYLQRHSFFQVVAAGTKSANPCFEIPLDGPVAQLQTKYDANIQTFRNFLKDLFDKETLKSKNVSLILDVGFNFLPKPNFKAFVIAPRLQLKSNKNERLALQSRLRANDTGGQFSLQFQGSHDNSNNTNEVDETSTSEVNRESGQSSDSSPKFCAILTRSPDQKVFFSGIQFYEQYPLLLSSHAYSQHTSGASFYLQDGCLFGHELKRSRSGRGASQLRGNVVGINSYVQGLRLISRCQSFNKETHNFVELPFLMKLILKWDGFDALSQSEMARLDSYIDLLRRTKYFQTPHANIFSDDIKESLVCRHEMYIDASNGIEEEGGEKNILNLDIQEVLGTEVALLPKADICLHYFGSMEKCRQMILHSFTDRKQVNLKNEVTAFDGFAKNNLLYASELLAYYHQSSSVTCQTVSENMGLFRRNLFKSKPHLPIHMPLSNIEPLLSKKVSCIAEDGSTIDVFCANLESFTAAPVLPEELQELLKDLESNDEQNISVANDSTLLINLAKEYQRMHKAKNATLHHNYRMKKNHELSHYVKFLALSELIDCVDNFKKIENVKRYVCALFWACYRLQIQEDINNKGYRSSSSSRMTSNGLGPMSEEALNSTFDTFESHREKISTIGENIHDFLSS